MADAPTNNNLTDQELTRSLWILRRQGILWRILKIILMVINVFLFGFTVWGLLDYFLITGPAERANLATQREQAIPYAELKNVLTPRALVFGEVQVLGGRENKYDLALAVTNNNDRVWAQFTYQLVGANFQSPPRRDFILPQSKKFLLELGAVASARPQNVRLVITDFRWQRLSRHTLPDYEQFKNEHLMFEISELDFSRSSFDRGTFNEVKFKIKNNSAYNFWLVPMQVALYRGGQTIGFNRATAEKLKSLETREISLLWEEGLPQVTSVEVMPDVNILDPEVYMP